MFEDNTVSNEIATPAPLPTTSATSKRNTVHLSHPVHVRSGSLPIEIGTSSSSNTTGIAKKSDMFASHRLKAHKERPPLQGCVFITNCVLIWGGLKLNNI